MRRNETLFTADPIKGGRIARLLVFEDLYRAIAGYSGQGIPTGGIKRMIEFQMIDFFRKGGNGQMERVPGAHRVEQEQVSVYPRNPVSRQTIVMRERSADKNLAAVVDDD